MTDANIGSILYSKPTNLTRKSWQVLGFRQEHISKNSGISQARNRKRAASYLFEHNFVPQEFCHSDRVWSISRGMTVSFLTMTETYSVFSIKSRATWQLFLIPNKELPNRRWLSQVPSVGMENQNCINRWGSSYRFSFGMRFWWRPLVIPFGKDIYGKPNNLILPPCILLVFISRGFPSIRLLPLIVVYSSHQFQIFYVTAI